MWSWLGSIIILSSLWIQVKIDVKINEWFGQFYDMIQKALGIPMLKPNNIGINSIKIIKASIKLVPKDSIIRENLIVSS